MAETAKPFAFTQFVPGFDFLRSLAGDAGAAGAVPGMPGLSSWVAPTLSVEEIDKRIQELKAVQFWLEQNVHAIKATLQALEVQKMTLSTLRGMNVRMEDLANAFARSTADAAAAAADVAREPAPPPAPALEPEAAAESPAAAAEPASASGAGVVDPLQWWGALTQQFQQIASNALQDAAQMKVPDLAAAVSGAEPARKAPARKAPAKRAKAPAAKPARKRSA